MAARADALDGGFPGLRALAGCGGCAAKAPPEMVALLAGLAAASGGGAGLLVGLAPPDDAAVYALDEQRALVATVDFFPPIVDDPETFGAVAAANAVSDVYAMGGAVALALAVSGFPEAVPAEVIASVNRAAAALVADCGGTLAGGHSIRCKEPVFGLCVLGFVHPASIWRKAGARPGDLLVLSKPLGTGILLSSGDAGAAGTAVQSMRRTNRQAAAALQALAGGPHAVTDVSGYGLLGHAREMATRSGVTLRLDADAVPLLDGALALARAGVRTSMHRRRAAADDLAPRAAGAVDPATLALLQDPQTSGGLLAAVAPTDAEVLRQAGFHVIGSVLAGDASVSLR
jgi:selenide,water dikinase